MPDISKRVRFKLSEMGPVAYSLYILTLIGFGFGLWLFSLWLGLKILGR